MNNSCDQPPLAICICVSEGSWHFSAISLTLACGRGVTVMLTAVYISEICTFDDVTILFRNFENGHIRNIATRSTFPEMYVRNPDLLNSCLSERPLFKLQVDT